MKLPKKGERVERAAQFVTSCNRLLDLGCEDGVLSHFVADRVKELYGVDNNRLALNEAKKLNYHTSYVDIDKSKLPYKNNFFDIVVSLDVIEHVYDPRVMISEIHRVLKRNGKVIISTPNIRFTNHIVDLIIHGRFPKTSTVKEPYDGGHLHFFTYKDIEDLLRVYKFKDIKHKSIINKPRRAWRGRALEKLFGKHIMREFRSQGILSIAKK